MSERTAGWTRPVSPPAADATPPGPAPRERAITAVRDSMNRLRGQLFEEVEAVGWPEGRQDAVKRLIRRTTYEAQADLEAILRRKEN